MKTIPFLSVLIVLAVIAVGCKGEESAGPTGPAARETIPTELVATSISVNPASYTIPTIGGVVFLTATVRDQNNNPMPNPMIQWSSNNTAVARVTGFANQRFRALVRAVSNGNAQITASHDSLTATASITVGPSPPDTTTVDPPTTLVATSISVTPDSHTFYSIGDTLQLTATVRDQNNNPMTDRVVRWASANSNQVTVNGRGVVTAISHGITQIRAHHIDGNIRLWDQATITVTSPPLPDPPDTTSLNPPVKALTIGIKPGSVRITNTSGGEVLVAVNSSHVGLYNTHQKPFIFHFTIEPYSDLDGFEDDGLCLKVDIDLPFMPRRGGGNWGGKSGRCLGRAALEKGIGYELWTKASSLGHWRSGKGSVTFSISKLYGLSEGWTINNAEHNDIHVDITDPIPGDIVFHPVIPGDSLGFSDEAVLRGMVWLEDQIEDLIFESRLTAELLHSPIVIRQFVIGAPVIIDTTGRRFKKGAYPCSAQDWGCLSLNPMSNRPEGARCGGALGLSFFGGCIDGEIDQSTTLDFHIAVASPVTTGFESIPFAAGAYQGSPFSYINTPRTLDNYAGVIIHEMGHSLGLDHVRCTGKEGYTDPNYPNETAHINERGYRFVVDWHGNVNRFDSFVESNEHYDFMSYCFPKWISAYSYRKMAEYRFGIEPTLVWTRPVVTEPRLVTCNLPILNR